MQVQYPIHCNAGKGIIEVVFKNYPTIWLFDKKTPGYPFRIWVGAYLIRGGCWENPADRSPLDTYSREMSEEFTAPKNADARLSANASWIVSCLVSTASPLWDYLLFVPESVHQFARRGPIAVAQSFFLSTLNGDELYDRFGINIRKDFKNKYKDLIKRLATIYTESDVGLLSETDLKQGTSVSFAFGDDQVFIRYLTDRKGFVPRMPVLEGIELEELPTSPLLPYVQRPFLDLIRINPLRRLEPDGAFYRFLCDEK